MVGYARTQILVHSPVFIALIPVAVVSGPCQIYWLNQGLAVFSASAVVPTYYVFFSLSAIIVGGLVYGDFDHMHYRSIAIFLGGVAMCISGVFIINSGRDVYYDLHDDDGEPGVAEDDCDKNADTSGDDSDEEETDGFVQITPRQISRSTPRRALSVRCRYLCSNKNMSSILQFVCR